MAEQARKNKTTRRDDDTAVHDATGAPAAQDAGEKLKAELDDLLDEIDGVLETNAEEFVKAYVQKGGQ